LRTTRAYEIAAPIQFFDIDIFHSHHGKQAGSGDQP
jgi:hypothetical protein